MTSEKLENSTKYLLCCSGLEEETFRLYQTIVKRMNQPEVCSLILSIGYDSLKHSKVIKELLKTIKKPDFYREECPDPISELWQYIAELYKQITEAESVSDQEFVEIFKALTDFEDCLSESYSKVLHSGVPQILSTELGKLTMVSTENLKRVFEEIIKDKELHREVLVDVGYNFSSKEKLTTDNAPIVRYKNPDGWIVT